MEAEMGLPARWISPIHGECLSAYAAEAYLREHHVPCRVKRGSLYIPAQTEQRFDPVETPMGRMFPMSQLEAILDMISLTSARLRSGL
ncbi:MAG: hypothetical protein HND48_02240 [Chloroflexi bacterium]|nr:hypothetical protein [Chloroflexota bacterium]